jgi:CDP-glucose 4,6-dehydratase
VTENTWHKRRVFLTGHTGFMGGWLAERLIGLGAEVTGYALPPATSPALFDIIGLAGRMNSIFGDVRNLTRLTTALDQSRADTVFHLAAQPLVRHAYQEPVETFATNVMGSVNMLEAMRVTGTVRAAVMVTTDKVYENREWAWGYREGDTLGGHEPYGASKACAELAIDAYVRSYFGDNGPAVATIRAGNIIGGGDWAHERLVPDAVRAFSAGETLNIRNPRAVRPWQHVLEPVDGMITLAQELAAQPSAFSGPWNLGPTEDDSRSVAWVADRLVTAWGGSARWTTTPDGGPRESHLLKLSSAKAQAAFGWRCRWTSADAIIRTAQWYRAYYDGIDMKGVTRSQINDYFKGEDRGELERQKPEERKRAVA